MIESSQNIRPFFWLHIRKAAGTSVLKSLSPYYNAVNRFDPLPFVAFPKEYWNDNLNSYRVPLGKYTFRRSLFAKKFLYDEIEFSDMYKFCVVRNPYERAYSCWKYLTKNHGLNLNPKSSLRYLSFSYFLDSIPDFWESLEPLHVATHTAQMWPDLTDEDGQTCLLDKIVYLEAIDEGMNEVFQEIGVLGASVKKLNATQKDTAKRHLTAKQKAKIERLYAPDFENLYPNI